jgi:tetratricopeptide (TPR) repeat protein
MLFQYQAQLGYSAREDEEEGEQRSPSECMQAKLSVLLKEGDYEQLVNLYYQAFKEFPLEPVFFDRFFEFLYVAKKPALMVDFAELYLAFLRRSRRSDKLVAAYKQILSLAPTYLPSVPEVRVQLASLCRQQGDIKLALKLLNGLHKACPNFIGLPQAYEQLADLLAELPGMQEQSHKARHLASQLQRKAELAQLAAVQAAEKTKQQPILSEPIKSQRKGGPTDSVFSGLTLELVPIDVIVEAD